ncbi:chaplin [Streptomyces sp. YS-3]|uniref:chaplin n=1 Tax=Streptomyces sp. YS-3 TaxID=3381352 RepID=UPI0038627EC1
MTNTKKYLLAALVGTALTLGSAAPAMADHGPGHGYGGHGSYGDRDHGDRDHREHGDHRQHGDRDRNDRDRGDRDRWDNDRGDSRGGECTNHGSAYAEGYVANSPGFLSGNLIQVVIDAPINICGNRIG